MAKTLRFRLHVGGVSYPVVVGGIANDHLPDAAGCIESEVRSIARQEYERGHRAGYEEGVASPSREAQAAYLRGYNEAKELWQANVVKAANAARAAGYKAGVAGSEQHYSNGYRKGWEDCGLGLGRRRSGTAPVEVVKVPSHSHWWKRNG